jgi:hypothetical protein
MPCHPGYRVALAEVLCSEMAQHEQTALQPPLTKLSKSRERQKRNGCAFSQL